MRQKVVSTAALVLLLAAALPALAGGCPAHYMDGRLPEIRNPKPASAARELCFEVFGVMHSGVTRTPLWSAEYLRADRLEAAQVLSRENSFHAEQQLPPSQRAELSNYARSGFDRGHMSPNGDMPDRQSQHESFTLANMVQQDADINRHVWAGIEAVVRKMARETGNWRRLTRHMSFLCTAAIAGANMSSKPRRPTRNRGKNWSPGQSGKSHALRQQSKRQNGSFG